MDKSGFRVAGFFSFIWTLVYMDKFGVRKKITIVLVYMDFFGRVSGIFFENPWCSSVIAPKAHFRRGGCNTIENFCLCAVKSVELFEARFLKTLFEFWSDSKRFVMRNPELIFLIRQNPRRRPKIPFFRGDPVVLETIFWVKLNVLNLDFNDFFRRLFLFKAHQNCAN